MHLNLDTIRPVAQELFQNLRPWEQQRALTIATYVADRIDIPGLARDTARSIATHDEDMSANAILLVGLLTFAIVADGNRF